ncbi:FAD-dependent oxidoreductase [Synechococcus sp. HB1133]|nr:FAD-dependent oxidoreductase [Synechococcus sp. HB1133]MCB4431184.1 FAD-dependent oxidoreductase [Synechococcus sp. HBA1120]NHI80407.1 FAD-dependent oxidoreductase [Synechococcus sp. HB1133]
MVGLSIAYQLKERKLAKNIIIIDKESSLGIHSSGRNSGVLHAGIYYKPETLKATVCVEGAKRLKSWIKDNQIEINECGKLIIPQREDQDIQLDQLMQRGQMNGAEVEMIGSKEITTLVGDAESCTGRALWSPRTAVVKPIEVINELEKQLKAAGVQIIKNVKGWHKVKNKNEILLMDGSKINYGYLIGAAGLYSDIVAHKFGIGSQYLMMPFKGLYWRLKTDCPISIERNIYPVPDLNLPFLGVHLTPSIRSDNYVSIGPTATPALGRENYNGIEKMNIVETSRNLIILATKYLKNEGNLREYTNQQAFLLYKEQIAKELRTMIPSMNSNWIQTSQKVGIRAQLYNKTKRKLEDDFVCLKGYDCLHVLNAISPAFTASFALADEIIDRTEL